MPAAARSRLAGRLRVLPRAILRQFGGRRTKPASPRRILVAHHLLPGDVLMITPLLAKLHERYPEADIAMTVRRSLAALYAGKPFGTRAIAFDPRDAQTLDHVFEPPGYDLACVPGDNRHAWLAAAAGARWIVAFDGDLPGYKSWPVDELRPLRKSPAAWGDLVADLVEGPPPRPHRAGDWPLPPCVPFALPQGRYAVLHVEASTSIKHWADEHWRTLAASLSGAGIPVVWSAGPHGEPYLDRLDPGKRHTALGHKLDLAQLWHLVSRASLLVCPDTSVMHIGRLTGTPTIALFGPSSPALYGPGEFLAGMPYRAFTFGDFPARDRRTLFKRELPWAPQSTGVEHAGDAQPVVRAAQEMAR